MRPKRPAEERQFGTNVRLRGGRHLGSGIDAMVKTAFIFPGQGSQYPGMGRELAEGFASARAVFAEADATLGFRISKLCFEGPEEALQLTANTQPAILAVSVAAAAVLREKGIRAQFVAGHSVEW